VGSSDAAFTALARQRCPAVGDVIMVMTGAFQRIDPDEMDAWLDELARPLFDVSRGVRPERLPIEDPGPDLLTTLWPTE
jgi:hypothetical protein